VWRAVCATQPLISLPACGTLHLGRCQLQSIYASDHVDRRQIHPGRCRSCTMMCNSDTCACMQVNHHRQWMRSLGTAPLLMLPVLLWFVMEVLHVAPRSAGVGMDIRPLLAGGANASGATNTAAEPPSPPPLDYWKKARMRCPCLMLCHRDHSSMPGCIYQNVMPP